LIIYKYDGTIEGYYTAVDTALKSKEQYVTFTIDTNIQLALDTEIIDVETNFETFRNMDKYLTKLIGSSNIYEIIYAFASADPDKDNIIFNYISLAIRYGKKVLEMLSHPYVVKMYGIVRKVKGESHRMLGFIRFAKTADERYYAAYSPDNNVTSIIMPHFVSRYSTMQFVIHDTKRGVLGIYDGNRYIVIKDERKATVCYADDEYEIQALWKKFYESVNIAERANKRQQNGYLPKKYRDYLTEFN